MAPRPAGHQALQACLDPEGQGAPLHHHLADPQQGKRLQPHLGHVPPLLEGEVLDHVRPRHRQPQPQERNILKLQTQKGKVVEQDLRVYSSFLIPVRKFCLYFCIVTTLIIPDDLASAHETICWRIKS